MAIRDWGTIELSTPALPARKPGRLPLGLIRSSERIEPAVLVTPLARGAAWGLEAPHIRLSRLAFALSADSRLVIVGEPLPPLAGIRFYVQDSVACPCGYRFDLPVPSAALRNAFELQEGDLALVSHGGVWERISAGQFVRATRSALRQSLAAIEVSRAIP